MIRIPTWTLGACALAAAGTILAAQPVSLDVVTVVGKWSRSVEDGATVVTSSPGTWDGLSGPDLTAVARSLFTAPQPEFAANSAPATAFPLAVVTSAGDFSEGSLRVQFKLVGGPSDQTAGIAFGLGPAADYFYVRYNTKDGNVAVWEFADGQRRVLAHGEEHRQLPLGAWHGLTVSVSGRRVTGKVEGTTLSVTHELPRAVNGRVGFWTKRDAVSAFKNLEVRRAAR